MKIIALTNDGQLSMMKNMLNSALRVGIDMSLFTCYRLHSQRAVAYYNTAEFQSITLIKLQIILDSLRKEDEVFWVDNDIVFFENPIPDMIKHKEMMVMQDDLWSPCTGFFIVRSNPVTIQLFEDCIALLKQNLLNSFVNDQTVFNEIYKKIPGVTLKLLPQAQYPNGKVYFDLNVRDKAKMLHCNYITNTFEKVARLKQFGLWDERNDGISKVTVQFYDQNEFWAYK